MFALQDKLGRGTCIPSLRAAIATRCLILPHARRGDNRLGRAGEPLGKSEVKSSGGTVRRAPRESCAVAKSVTSGKGRNRRLVIGAVVIVALAAPILWIRPWTDSVMSATVSVSTDEEGVVTVYQARKLFSASNRRRPVFRAEFDLRSWEDRLVCLDVQGNVSPRRLEEESTGYVACAAELMDPTGTTPVEFVGWQQGSKLGLHVGPVGPRSFEVEGVREPRFAFATKGTLWHVLRVPSGARLRVYLRPVLAVDVAERPQPFLPSAGAERRSTVGRNSRPPERPPDVFIYLIDALRPDHLGCHGYNRGTSPAIDAFASQATVYEEAHAPTPWTRGSVATMLSGLYASVHGAVHESDMLDEWPVLLPEMLQEAGYRTQCITTNGMVTGSFGFDQGYDDFIFLDQATPEWVNSMVGKLLAREEAEPPVFMFVLTLQPHGPYVPRPDSLRRFDRGLKGRYDGSEESLQEAGMIRPKLSEEDIGHLVDLYDAEVFDADEGFAGFLDVLRTAGRDENALIILVSDHGESFAEHDTLGHGWNLNRENMRVVLIIRFPHRRFAGVRVAQPASLIDVLPTVLAEVGLSPELSYELAGRDLSRAAQHPETMLGRRVYGETSVWDTNDLDLVAVIDEDGYKRVIDVSVLPRETATRKSIGLWDTRADPDETVDLLERMPVRAAYGEQLIARWLVAQSQWRHKLAAGPPPRIELTEELREQLHALGYLRGGPSTRHNAGAEGEGADAAR